MSDRLPIWELPLSENSRTKMTERHGDLTMTVSCVTLTAATIIAIPMTAITTAIVATTKAPCHDGCSHGMAISHCRRFRRHRNVKQCHVEGVGQGLPLPLWGGGQVITIFTCYHMHTVLIKYK